MLNNISLSRLYDTNSKVHKLNALFKLVSIMILTTGLIVNNNIYYHGLILIWLFIVMLISKIPLKKFLSSLYFLNIFLISIFIINLIFKMNLIDNVVQILRIVELVLYSSIIIMTTSTDDIISSVETLISPLKLFKVDIKSISFILALSIKFIPMVLDIANKIIKSLEIRGIDYHHTTIKNKIYILKAIVVPICFLSLKKADSLADIMELRFYNISNKKTKQDINFKDVLWLIITLLLLSLALLWR